MSSAPSDPAPSVPSPADSARSETASPARPSSRLRGLVDDPRVQGAVGGLLTLVPARRWPRVVRAVYLWGPATLVGGGLVVMAAIPESVAARLRTIAGEVESRDDGPQAGPTTSAPLAGEPAASADESPAAESAPPLRRVLAGLAVGIVAGGATHGVARFSLWADDAAERGLRRLGIRRPRAVMAVAAGLGLAAMTEAENRAGRRRAVATPEPPASSPQDQPSSAVSS